MFYLSITLLFLFLIFLLTRQYIFNIYEVDFIVKPEGIFADTNSVIRIESVPVNSFGKRVPFKYVECEFKIVEGSELVNVIVSNKMSGKLIIRTGNQGGRVVIKIHSNYSLCAAVKEINIQKILRN